MGGSQLWNSGSDSLLWNATNDCQEQLGHILFNSSKNFSPYYDATGKLGSGLVNGVMVSLGDYSACTQLPDSKYCLADIKAKQNLPGSVNTTSVHLVWGLCVINLCNVSTLQNITPVLIENVLSTPWIVSESSKVSCSNSLTLNRGFWTTIAILIILALLVLLGTILDLYHQYSARMRWNLLYHVSTNVRHMVGARDGHMTWTTVDESFASNESMNGDSSMHDDTGSDSNEAERPPNSQLLVQAFNYKPGPVVRIGQCFSLASNLETLCTRSLGALPCLDGLRVMSLVIIILGQTVLGAFNSSNLINPHKASSYTKHVDWVIITNSFCAIDTFFVLGGLLVVYKSLTARQNSDKFSMLGFYLRRIFRLLPSVAVVLLVWLNIVPFIGSGPFWHHLTDMIESEHKYWWSTLLFVQNFYPTSLANSCMDWLWYLSADFQLYVFTPILLQLVFRNKAMAAVFVPLIASIVVTGVLIGAFGLNVNVIPALIGHSNSETYDYYSLVLDKPYCRATAYLVGAWLGYKLYTHSGYHLRLTKRSVAIGWSLCIVLGATTVFATYPLFLGHKFGTVGSIVYGSLRHVAWAAAIAWIIHCCIHGYAGPVGYVLSCRFWTPMGKLTFGAFLCHGIVLSVFYHSQQAALVMTFTTMSSIYLSALVVSYLMALCVTLLIELPAHNLVRLICS